eukprot:Ihof_evm6s450 gene=Ihof_evmTU6s450
MVVLRRLTSTSNVTRIKSKTTILNMDIIGSVASKKKLRIRFSADSEKFFCKDLLEELDISSDDNSNSSGGHGSTQGQQFPGNQLVFTAELLQHLLAKWGGVARQKKEEAPQRITPIPKAR